MDATRPLPDPPHAAPPPGIQHHDALAALSPADRALYLLRLVEAADDARLHLPEADGLRHALHNLHFDETVLGELLAAAEARPPWWHEEGRLQLRHARLRGANLEGANLARIDLTGADFSGALLRAATLDGAKLEQAAFARADLSATGFAAAAASQADFSGALGEDARFSGATLRFANFREALLEDADFAGADLWGARFDGAEAPLARFGGAVLREAGLAGADLGGADLRGAKLQDADLTGASLRRAVLRDVEWGRARLDGADLAEAELVQANLLACSLRHVRLAGAWMDRTRLRIDQFGGALGEEVAGEWAAARQGYLDLEQNFRGLGDAESSSWCYRRARRMGRRAHAAAARAAARLRAWRPAANHAANWASDTFVEWLCDYGDSLPRVIRAYAVVLFAFAAVYLLTGSLLRPDPVSGAFLPDHDLIDVLSFSFLNQITSTTPDLGLKLASRAVYVAGSLQYVCGVVLIGLFGFVLGNRIRR